MEKMIKKGLLVWLALLHLCVKAQHFYTSPADSILRPITNRYSHKFFINQILLGTNYRDVWATPVKFAIFNFKKSGLKIKELGGGMQTKSLRLEDSTGKEWVLRTIDKEVADALPPKLRNTLAQRVVQDMVSGAFPYAPLTIHPLATAVKVPAANPIFYYVPDDGTLGEYEQYFAHKICMLEEREPTADNSETINTEDLVKEILEGKNHVIREQELLRARLLDMLIADWDRHADQWRWVKKDIDNYEYYYAIPRDRDQAYFLSNGLIVKLARIFGMRHLTGFRKTTTAIRNLNSKAWHFDGIFLNSLEKHEWATIIKYFQEQLTDSIIATAVKRLPQPVYASHGKTIEQKLRTRRDGLLKNGLKYYRFLSHYVTVIGTKQDDLFSITGNRDSLTVTVSSLEEKNKNMVRYQRTFYPKETDEIKLIGLEGADQFIVDEKVSAHIKIKIDGGKGDDTYTNTNRIKAKLYDSDTDAKSFTEVLKPLLRIR